MENFLISNNVNSLQIPNLNQSICIECYEFLTTLEKYADRCRSVDKMFIELSQQNRESSQMSDNDILSLRYKYGIDFIEVRKKLPQPSLTKTNHIFFDSVHTAG